MPPKSNLPSIGNIVDSAKIRTEKETTNPTCSSIQNGTTLADGVNQANSIVAVTNSELRETLQ